MNLPNIDNQITEIQNGTRDLLQFNQPEHAGVCSAGPILIGALIVCHNARESLSASSNATGGQRTLSNWTIDEAQDSSGVNYISPRLHLEDMHPANIFVEELTSTPVRIDCIVKFRRD